MFNRDVMCINDLVDGITLYKIYTATHIEHKDNEVYYGIVDDYGVYNMFKQRRFVTVNEKMINSICEYKSNINMEKLTITRLCLEEILQNKIELESENDLQDSVSYGLNLTIKNLKEVIKIIDDKLEDYR